MSLLADYDRVFQQYFKLSTIDQNRIAALTMHEGWPAYEKMIQNITLKFYQQILVDEDVKAARKLVNFSTAIKNFAKSKRQYGNDSTKEPLSSEQDTFRSTETGEIFL